MNFQIVNRKILIAVGIFVLIGAGLYVVTRPDPAILSEAKIDIASIMTITEKYYTDHGYYPSYNTFTKGEPTPGLPVSDKTRRLLFTEEQRVNQKTNYPYQYEAFDASGKVIKGEDHPCKFMVSVVSSPLGEGTSAIKSWMSTDRCK